MALTFPLVVPWVSHGEIDPSGHLELLAWVALVPLLRALGSATSGRAAFLRGLTAGAVFFTVTVHWLARATSVFGIGSPALAWGFFAALILFLASYWGAVAAFEFSLRTRLGAPPWMTLPCLWVAMEFLRTYLLTGFPWANLGYSQARHPVVAQLASVFGVYGVAWIVVFANCVLHETLRTRWRPQVRLLFALAAMLLVTCFYGRGRINRLSRQMSSAETLKVGIVQPNLDRSTHAGRRASARQVLSRLVPLTEEADRAGANLIVWPESAYPIVFPSDIGTLEGAPHLRPLRQANILMGISTAAWAHGLGKPTATMHNSALLLRPDLSVAGRSDKHHLVPFGEYLPFARWLPGDLPGALKLPDARPGSEFMPLEAPREKAGRREFQVAPLICYDAIFPTLAREHARRGPALLVNLSNESWAGHSSEPAQFLGMTRLRAIETGRAVVRASYTGLSAIVLPTGEMQSGALPLGLDVGSWAPGEHPPALLLGDVPLLGGSPPYLVIGDALAWACIAVVIAGMVWAFLCRWCRKSEVRLPGLRSAERY